MTDKPAMTIEERAIQITGNCTCIDGFKDRGLIDPQCVYHECYDDIMNALTEVYARGRRDGLDEAAKQIEEWAVYFDRYEAYCGKYAPSTGRETLTPQNVRTL